MLLLLCCLIRSFGYLFLECFNVGRIVLGQNQVTINDITFTTVVVNSKGCRYQGRLMLLLRRTERFWRCHATTMTRTEQARQPVCSSKCCWNPSSRGSHRCVPTKRRMQERCGQRPLILLVLLVALVVVVPSHHWRHVQMQYLD